MRKQSSSNKPHPVTAPGSGQARHREPSAGGDDDHAEQEQHLERPSFRSLPSVRREEDVKGAKRILAARHADPRTTMRYDRARKNLDRHPNYIPRTSTVTPPTPSPPTSWGSVPGSRSAGSRQ